MSCDRCDESLPDSVPFALLQMTRHERSAVPAFHGSPTETQQRVKTLALCSPACSVPSRLQRSIHGFCAILLATYASSGSKWLFGQRSNASSKRKAVFSWNRVCSVSLSHVCSHSFRCKLPFQTKVFDTVRDQFLHSLVNWIGSCTQQQSVDHVQGQ